MSVRLSSYFLPITVMNNWFVYILYKFPRLTILIECRKFEVKSPNFAGGGGLCTDIRKPLLGSILQE